MRLIKLSVVALLPFWATPALADWQYTRWGMTPAQVAAASKGSVTVGPGNPQEEYPAAKIGASGTYTSGNYRFRVNFHFVDNKLVDVRLKLITDDPTVDGNSLKHSLDGAYGKPFQESKGILRIVTYHDTAKNNRIDLMVIDGQSASLEYQPLVDESASGL